jgi:hypothetical protein
MIAKEGARIKMWKPLARSIERTKRCNGRAVHALIVVYL